jgi:hypothetical protein
LFASDDLAGVVEEQAQELSRLLRQLHRVSRLVQLEFVREKSELPKPDLYFRHLMTVYNTR